MLTILQDAINVLKENGHTPEDVLWVGCAEFKTDWKNFEEVADIEESREIAVDIIVNGETFWLERYIDDCTSWWVYREKKIFYPPRTARMVTISKEDPRAAGYEDWLGGTEYETLAGINGYVEEKPKWW